MYKHKSILTVLDNPSHAVKAVGGGGGGGEGGTCL